MTRDGHTCVLADRIDGQPVGRVNFVLRDSRDRIWITVSTRVTNWMHALRADLADGYIARYDRGAFHIVTEDVLFATGQGIAPWMASVTFGGPDLRTVYIGSLKGNEFPVSVHQRPACPWCIGMPADRGAAEPKAAPHR